LKPPLLGNGSPIRTIARQWLSSRHVTAAADKHATIEELFSVRSVPKLYTGEQCHYGESRVL
jgi:hypothetical protein